MRNRFLWQPLMIAVVGVLVDVALTPAAQADLVAYWMFNGDNFLADSSGNGHTLTSSGAVSPSSNAALLNGGLFSAANLDLSGYRQVTFSWDMESTGTGEKILFEHSGDYNGHVGAMIGLVNGSSGNVCLRCPTTYNSDNFTVGSGMNHYVVTYDLDAASVADVVKVSTGSGAGTASGDQAAAPTAFINATFNIGDRQNGNVEPFIGTIDNFKIEGTPNLLTPEPNTLLLVVTGVLGLLCYAWRRQK